MPFKVGDLVARLDDRYPPTGIRYFGRVTAIADEGGYVTVDHLTKGLPHYPEIRHLRHATEVELTQWLLQQEEDDD